MAKEQMNRWMDENGYQSKSNDKNEKGKRQEKGKMRARVSENDNELTRAI